MAPIETLPLEILRLITTYCLAGQIPESDEDNSFKGYIIWNKWNSNYPDEVFNLALASKTLRSRLSSVIFENLKFVSDENEQKLLCGDIFASPLSRSSPKLIFNGKNYIYSEDMLRSVCRLILKFEQAGSDLSVPHPPLDLITPDSMPKLKLIQIEIYKCELCDWNLLNSNLKKFNNDLCIHLKIFESHTKNESALASILNRVDFHLLVKSLTLSIYPIQLTQNAIDQILRFENLRKFVAQCPEKIFMRLTTDGDGYRTWGRVQFIKRLKHLEKLLIFPEFPFQRVISQCQMSNIKSLAIDIAYFQSRDLTAKHFKSVKDLTLFIEDTNKVPERLPFTNLTSLYIARYKKCPMETLEYLTATNCYLSNLALESMEVSDDFRSSRIKAIFSGISRLKICGNGLGLASQNIITAESILRNAPNLETLYMEAKSENLISIQWLADEMIRKTISENLGFIFINTAGMSLEISNSPLRFLESDCFNNKYETIGTTSDFCYPVKEFPGNTICQAFVIEVAELRKRLRDHNYL